VTHRSRNNELLSVVRFKLYWIACRGLTQPQTRWIRREVSRLYAHVGTQNATWSFANLLPVARKALKTLVPRAGVEPARPYGQRILSLKSRTTPSLTKHNKPRSSGMVSRQSQLHSGRFEMRSRHLHVILRAESHPLGQPRKVERLDLCFSF
jgi:hypothetical protein